MLEKKMVKKLFFSEIVYQNVAEKENDPIYNLISNYKEIETIKDSIKNKKIFYFCKNKIHQILYDEEELIVFNEKEKSDIENNLIKNNISEFFYLSLLVSYNKVQIDYEYDFENIRIMYKYLKEKDAKDLKKLILSKIIYSLIINYTQYIENEEHNNEIDLMKKNIENIFSELKIEYSFKIDIIYLQIINSLIENKKFDNYEYCYDTIKQLDLENIDITSTIFEGLKKTLNNTKDNYMKNYSIDNIKDLSNETKINFYYLIIVYILKNTIYIYNINFLYKNIRKIIKLLLNNRDLPIKNEKLKTIINNLFPNLKLSVNKIHNSDNIFINKAIDSSISDARSSNNIVSNMSFSGNNYSQKISDMCRAKKSSFSSIFNESEFNIINNNKLDNKLNENIPLKNKGIASKALEEFNFQIVIEYHELDKKEKIRVFFENMICGREKKNIYLEDLKEEFKYYQTKYENKEEEVTKEYIIYKNFKELLFFLKEIDNYIKISKIKINSKFRVELKREENNIKRENKEDKNIYNLSCIYKFSNEKNEYYFKDDDILVNNIDSKKHGFLFLINELSNYNYD